MAVTVACTEGFLVKLLEVGALPECFIYNIECIDGSRFMFALDVRLHKRLRNLWMVLITVLCKDAFLAQQFALSLSMCKLMPDVLAPCLMTTTCQGRSCCRRFWPDSSDD